MLAGLAAIPWVLTLAAACVGVYYRLRLSEALGDVGTAEVRADREKIRADRADVALVVEEEKVAALTRRSAADAVAYDAAQRRIAELERQLLERAQPGDGQAALAAGFGERKS